MTTVQQLPFGAETPDDFLVPYVNGSLTPPERDEVDRWLASHPEWGGRVAAYRAIGGSVRQAAAASQAPDVGSMNALWATIDAHPQPRPLRPLAPPPPPGGGYGYAGPGAPQRPGRGPGGWLLAVAALVLVALAGAAVVLAVTRTDSSELSERRATTTADESPTDEDSGGAAEPPAASDTTPEPVPTTEPVPTATGGPPGATSAAAQALREGAVATADQETAHTSMHAVGVVDFRGTDLTDLVGADEATVTIDGVGQVQFPDRSRLDTTATMAGGLFDSFPAEEASTVEIGDRVWVSCAGGDYVEELPSVESQCTGLGFGTAFFGPEAAIDILEGADSDVTEVGTEDIDGMQTTRYSLVMNLSLDETRPEEEVPVTIDVWVGVDDGLIHQVRATTAFTLPLDLFDETHELPTTLEMTYRLSDFGAAVDIPDLG